LIVRVAIGVAAVCVLVLIIVAIAQAVPAPPAAPQEVVSLPRVNHGESGGVTKSLSLNSFIIADKLSKGLENEKIQWRARLGTWNERMIAAYWIPTAQIGLENMAKMNDNNIDRLFSDVK
jgi:hypothetical protein